MRFAANLGFLYARESLNLIDRIKFAGAAGFRGIEYPYPYDIPASLLSAANKEAEVEQVLINSWPGNRESGDNGIAIDPTRCREFREKLELSVIYLKELGCRRLHVLAGKLPPGSLSTDEIEKTYVNNVRYAAERMAREGVTVLIEPINNRTVPGYWLNDPEQGARIVRQIGHPNLRLQLDVFHAQIAGGDLSRRIQDWLPLIGHIQIAQVPNRDEPDSSGEINYRYVLELLESSGYEGWIGLEYTPRSHTNDGLDWIKNLGFSLK